MNLNVSSATGFPNVLSITVNKNFHFKTSKLEWQGIHAAAEIRQNHPQHKAFYTSINPVHSEAKQPVEFHRETADGVLTPQFNRSNENPIIYLKEKRAEGWRSLSSHHQKQNPELGDSASIPCQLWWWGLSRPCSWALRVGIRSNGSQHAPTAGRREQHEASSNQLQSEKCQEPRRNSLNQPPLPCHELQLSLIKQ